MKKIITLALFSFIALTSCSDGDPGPQGPPGEDGLIGSVVDVTGDFSAANNYELSLNFNDVGLEVFESDVVLVYLKTGEDGTAGGQPVEVFRQLPQTYYINGQALQYNFDYTFFDVLIFLDGTADFGSLDPSYTDDQVLRVVVVPAEFAETSGVDVSNMGAVMKALDLQENDIEKASLKK